MKAIDELGPVDCLVVEFPSGTQNFTGEVARELTSLVEAELVHVLDVLILEKGADGSIEAFELDELEHVDELRAIEGEVAEILAAEDVAHLAEAMDPGSVAGVIIWENAWATPFAAAVRHTGGQLVAHGVNRRRDRRAR